MNKFKIPQLDFNNVISSIIYNDVELLKEELNFSNLKNLLYQIEGFLNDDDFLIIENNEDSNFITLLSQKNSIKSITINSGIIEST